MAHGTRELLKSDWPCVRLLLQAGNEQNIIDRSSEYLLNSLWTDWLGVILEALKDVLQWFSLPVLPRSPNEKQPLVRCLPSDVGCSEERNIPNMKFFFAEGKGEHEAMKIEKALKMFPFRRDPSWNICVVTYLYQCFLWSCKRNMHRIENHNENWRKGAFTKCMLQCMPKHRSKTCRGNPRKFCGLVVAKSEEFIRRSRHSTRARRHGGRLLAEHPGPFPKVEERSRERIQK